MTPDEKLFDEVLSQALNVLRLGASKRAEVVRRLQAMATEYVQALQGDDLSKRKRKDVERFLANAEKIVAKHYDIIQDGLELSGIAETVSFQTANSLQMVLGLDAVGKPKDSYFKSVQSDVLIEGSPSRDWWKGQELDTQRRFAGAVRQGLLNGETNQQIIRRIVGTAEEPGAMDIARRNAASLVQTSVQAVANDARRETFDANSDVIKGLRQVSTLDTHTSKVCIAYSGASWNLKKEPLNGSPPWNGGCPRHFNCRSVEVPITKTFRELGVNIDEAPTGTRASEDGQIAAGTTFAEFLERKGKAYQDEVLGEGRADLWRAGKITLRDLVSGDGRPMTLAELQGRYRNHPGTFIGARTVAALPLKAKQPFRTWKALERNAETGLGQFREAFGNVAKKMKLRTDVKPDDLTGDLVTNDDGFLFIAPPKSYARALEKVTDDYDGDWSQVNDIVRGTISVSSLREVKAAINAMRAEGLEFSAKPKDRFANPAGGGYRDILGLVRLPNGMNAEIQFHVKEMTEAKNLAHKYYEISRTLAGRYPSSNGPDDTWSKADADAWRDAEKKQVDIYNAAWDKVLARS